MFSLRSTLAAAVALIAGVQAEYFIEPSGVPVSTRNNWCTSQRTQCTPICLDFAPQSGRPLKNTCDAATLTYECVCGNNQSPNLTEYSQTMPYHKCVQFQTNCITNCGASNNACSSKCQNDIKCGASSPKGATNATASTTDGSNSPATTTSSSGTQLQTNAFGGGGGGGGSSMGATSTSLQTSLTLAVSIAGILIGPLLL